MTESKDFWKLLRRNFVVSFRYLSDFLFWFFVEEKNTILLNEEIIRYNICNIELNYLTGLANPALLLNKKKYGKYSNIRASEPNFKRCFASSFKEKRGHGPGKDKVGRGFSSLGTFKLKKISTVVHAPWCLGDLRHYTNH